ncbi:Hypothetical protein D9617_21g097940 [Elsinoe fawcettii]|nr:Hypothetical protein D9617_21g097940 [Elsinoe fawcettii]
MLRREWAWEIKKEYFFIGFAQTMKLWLKKTAFDDTGHQNGPWSPDRRQPNKRSHEEIDDYDEPADNDGPERSFKPLPVRETIKSPGKQQETDDNDETSDSDEGSDSDEVSHRNKCSDSDRGSDSDEGSGSDGFESVFVPPPFSKTPKKVARRHKKPPNKTPTKLARPQKKKKVSIDVGSDSDEEVFIRPPPAPRAK